MHERSNVNATPVSMGTGHDARHGAGWPHRGDGESGRGSAAGQHGGQPVGAAEPRQPAGLQRLQHEVQGARSRHEDALHRPVRREGGRRQRGERRPAQQALLRQRLVHRPRRAVHPVRFEPAGHERQRHLRRDPRYGSGRRPHRELRATITHYFELCLPRGSPWTSATRTPRRCCRARPNRMPTPPSACTRGRSAFLELQFYPPGFAPFPDSSAATARTGALPSTSTAWSAPLASPQQPVHRACQLLLPGDRRRAARAPEPAARRPGHIHTGLAYAAHEPR